MPPADPVTTSRMQRAWYAAGIDAFLRSTSDLVFARLAANPQFPLTSEQREAWLSQIDLLQSCLHGLAGSIYLEFSIPRMGRRVDAILLVGPVVFVVEFKVGATSFDRAAVDQVWDYALDLKNFHEASHGASLVPILVATGVDGSALPQLEADADKVYRPLRIGPATLRNAIDLALRAVLDEQINRYYWESAAYRPTPTIIEAARALYAQHSVEAIARNDAGVQNLRTTSRRIEELVRRAREQGSKIICFVTGVPGAGKTLVGLNVATRQRDANETSPAVFLSGNGPLVAVLREALTRDEFDRRRARGESVRKGKIGESVKAFIQNVHHFRDDALEHPGPPAEHVVIFDEAQRAWNVRQAANFMRRKKGYANFCQSEPEFLISCLDRHADWGVIVCLVGGGQEINTGEAGITAWIEAVEAKFKHWEIHISSRLTDTEYMAGKALEVVRERPGTCLDNDLHLAVSMRSFRADNVSSFVKLLLDCERDGAREAYRRLAGRYPIVVTRDLDLAKDWVREHARGTERYGLVASSRAMRLKPHAVDVRVNINPVHWFLDGRDDTRSSYYLEDAATEFQVQGLELDWACVTWDGDLRFAERGWTYHDFRGKSWQSIRNTDNRDYLRNAYRVLLTRARQGMAIFVPTGDTRDPTRSPAYYDSTFAYLTDLGLPLLSS